ncbi:YARHG domain-containing protein [Aquimarina aquimarini]|uniref:YARHG domain-containing protein n=1 Tax=Aquimarina aquimarini TaxID=1191734 RepID=UPI001F492B98|nr:YARHG domain-containing protein [Aquimarina aquimarini]
MIIKSAIKVIRVLFFVFLCSFSPSCNKEKYKENISVDESTDANFKLLTEKELNSKSINELRIIRNKIFAKKGYVFKSKDLQQYFKAKKWYVPKENLKISLSEIEKQNIELIKQIESKKKKNTNPEKFIDTIHINYNTNNIVLDILTLLPETNMGSWDWSQKERSEMVTYIKKNNFIIDSTEMYLNIAYVEPNTIGLQVVDGFWSLSVYSINQNDHILITNDIVGDGNSIRVYSLTNETLKPLNMQSLFGDYTKKLINTESKNCLSMLEENGIMFDYDFSNKDYALISSSWITNDDEYKGCFIGNTIKFRFNKVKRLFEIDKIYWNKTR